MYNICKKYTKLPKHVKFVYFLYVKLLVFNNKYAMLHGMSNIKLM